MPRIGYWVNPDVATGNAPEFAPLDLVEGHYYVAEGVRRRVVVSGEAKAGRVQRVEVMSEPFSSADSFLLLDDARSERVSFQFTFGISKPGALEQL